MNSSSFEVSRHGKIALLQRLLSQHQPASCVVFCNTKRDCQAVCDALNAAGQSALSLHGDLEQRDRDQTLVRFANGSVRVSGGDRRRCPRSGHQIPGAGGEFRAGLGSGGACSPHRPYRPRR
ncbi:helicase-related protein [Klebsiella pneumoniae]|nr:helicase-related protein [Klebsiella pneumoniae]